MKFFKKWESIWHVALYETRIFLLSSKFILVSLISWAVLDISTRTVRQFAVEYDLSIPPAILPFYLSDLVFGNIVYLLLVLLVCDVPLKHRTQKQILQRCGMTSLALGQMVSLVLVSALFYAEQMIFSMVMCLPRLSFDGWGKLWGSLATDTFLEAGYSSSFNISQVVLREYSLWQAIGYSAVTFILTGICYGLVVFLFNGLSRGRLGTAIVSGWSVIWIFLKSNTEEWVRNLMRYSPQNWNDLSLHTASGMTEQILFVTGIILVLVAVILLLVKTRRLPLAD